MTSTPAHAAGPLGALRVFIHGPSVEPAVDRAFEAHCDDLMGRASPGLLVLFVCFVVVWWPADWVVYADQPGARRVMATARVAVIVNHLLWLTVGLKALRRHPVRWGSFVAISEAWLLGAAAGLGGGLDTPWPYFMYIWPLVSVCLVRPLWARLWRVLLMGVGTMACYLMASDTPLDHPSLPPVTSYLLFCCLFSTLVGHGAWLLFRVNFIQRRQIETQRERLDGSRQALEQQVAEQTRNLQVLSQRLETLREEERGWMARELHDALGQELTGARYAIDLVRTRLSGPQARLDGALGDVNGRLGRAHESVRTMLQRLRPRVLDELGVAAALSWLCDDFARRAEIEVEFTAEPPGVRVAPAIETALYRVAAEALSNVVRHAEARRVAVRFEVGEGGCSLTVEDDGVGFDPDAVASPGVGLIGIRERLVGLGGRATWRRGAAGGTALRVEAPLGGPAA